MTDHTEYPIATLCGSMRYFDRMLKVAADLTGSGWIVLMPFVKKDEGSTDIEMLDDMHRTKISMSDRMYVVGSYIGDSTKAEIDYAREHDIDVIRLYTSERAMAGMLKGKGMQ
jgi:hypothetical protein